MIIGIDFDGTIVEHEYPRIGAPVPGAIDSLRSFSAQGHRLILWTMRSGDRLAEAVHYIESHGVELFGVNENPEQHEWTDSPKAYCHRYIDDAAVGCPLVHPDSGRPYVDWSQINI